MSDMQLLPVKFLDIRGRLIINNGTINVISDYPKLRCISGDYGLTHDGVIINLYNRQSIDLDVKISQINVDGNHCLALTRDCGSIIELQLGQYNNHRVLMNGVDRLIERIIGNNPNIMRILIVNNKGYLCEVRWNADDPYNTNPYIMSTQLRHIGLGAISYNDVIKTNEGWYVISTLGKTSILRLSLPNNVIGIALCQSDDYHYNDGAIVLDDNGQIHHYTFISGKITKCQNELVSELGSVNKWIRIVQLVGGYIGIINEIGQLFAIDRNMNVKLCNVDKELFIK